MAFFLSPWHVNNVWHMHNDNLISSFFNARYAEGGALGQGASAAGGAAAAALDGVSSTAQATTAAQGGGGSAGAKGTPQAI